MLSNKSLHFLLRTQRGNLTRLSSTPTIIATRSLAVLPFKLADIGEGIAEVELMKWFVKTGDSVKSFDRICEVQSDKATVEITSRYDGVITKVHHDEGSIVKVGATLVDIEVAGAAPVEVTKSAEPEVKAPVAAAASTTQVAGVAAGTGNKVFATPAVRRIAKENKLDLSLVPATGPKGRVLKEDVLTYLKKGKSSETVPTSVASTPSSSDTKVPIRGVQRLMVKSMNAANQVQHLTLCEEVTFDKLKKLRNDLKTTFAKKGIKLSYMPLIIKATSLALLQYPMLNATVNAEVTELTYHGNHNIGIAMDTPKGLVVPVIKAVQNKSIVEIATELNKLQEAAMTGTITEAQLSGGTFSLSNIGSVGGTYAVPVVVVPQVAIGAFGRLQVLPRYVDKHGNPASHDAIDRGEADIKPSTIMNVSWSADHRVLDGATVAKFSNVWKNYLENPEAMITDMR